MKNRGAGRSKRIPEPGSFDVQKPKHAEVRSLPMHPRSPNPARDPRLLNPEPRAGSVELLETLEQKVSLSLQRLHRPA